MSPRLPIWLVAGLCLVTSAASADLVTMATQAHPLASSLVIDFYINGPAGTGDLLGTTGPIAVSGPAVLDLNLDSGNSGTAILLSSNLFAAPHGPQTIDLGTVGTIDFVATNVHAVLEGPGIVTNTVLTAVPGTYDTISFIGGTAEFVNPTGIVATLLAGLDLSYDFDADPIVDRIRNFGGIPIGSIDGGPGLFSPMAEFNLEAELSYPIISSPVELYANFTFDVHYAVPEASSATLLGAAAAGIGLAAAWRRRSTSLSQ